MRHSMAGVTIAALLVGPVLPAGEPGEDALARVDAFVAAERARSAIPGLALAVVKDGRAIMAKGYGLANVEHQVPVTARTVFQSGSVAKPFAATALMLLAEDGKLSLDDPVTRFFPDAPVTWRGMTIRHLLSHTSGMGDYPEDFDVRRDYTEDEMLAVIKKAPLAFDPGERWSYSNLGYVTLGILIGKASGRFYGDYLAERVFKPLGMSSARVISEADIVPNRAAGYRLEGRELKNQTWVAPSVNTTADGSLYLTLDDMLKWEAALAAGTPPLTRSLLERMWTPARLKDGETAPYGFGWFTRTAGARRLIFHAGAWQGFKCFIARFPDDRLTVILLANLAEANEFRIVRGVASVFIPELALGAAPVDETEPEVTALARRLLRQLAAGTVDPELVTVDDLAPSPRTLQAMRTRLEGLSLPPAHIASLELLGRADDGELRIYRYALTDITSTTIFKLTLAKDGKVVGMSLAGE
jgi:CubicO group peptidase (beta-lactamase class C family)